MGAQVVYIYPSEWNRPDLYGQVVGFDEDGTFYLFEAERGMRKLVDYDNMLEHGARLRPMNAKEKYPSAKAYVTPAEKRARTAKRKQALQ